MKETFYLIARKASPYAAPYLKKEGGYLGYTSDIKDAAQFESVPAALTELGERNKKYLASGTGTPNGADTLNIVRVDRTEGTKTLKIVSKRHIDAMKPCVIYTGSGFVGQEGQWDSLPLHDARIFADLNEALVCIDTETMDPVNHEELKVFNVEQGTSEPVETLTVLK